MSAEEDKTGKIINTQKIENTLKFYILARKLKDLVRTGWLQWHIDADRVESVAEHIYGTMMLAISIHSEFCRDDQDSNSRMINIDRVLKMLAVHEIEEIRIGDITPFDNVTPSEKRRRGKIAVSEICSTLELGSEYIKLIDEFENQETEDAKFAKMCDKLEADIQAKVYDEKKYFDIDKEENAVNMQNELIIKFQENGSHTVSEFFAENNKNRYSKEFSDIADYVVKNNITKYEK